MGVYVRRNTVDGELLEYQQNIHKAKFVLRFTISFHSKP